MALTRLCPFCLEPLVDCLCEDDEPAASAAATAPHAVADEDTPPPYRGVITIEWPPPGPSPYACMTGRLVKVFNALTGKPITTCASADITVHADAASIVTADLVLFADADGEPLFEGEPVTAGGEIRTGTFPFVVSEMRVRQA